MDFYRSSESALVKQELTNSGDITLEFENGYDNLHRMQPLRGCYIGFIAVTKIMKPLRGNYILQHPAQL